MSTNGHEPELLDRIRGEMRERLAELAPLVDEYARLTNVAIALDGSSAFSNTPATPAPAPRPRASITRPRPERQSYRKVEIDEFLAAARDLKTFNTPQIADHLGIPKYAAMRHLHDAIEAQQITKFGDRGPKVYFEAVTDDAPSPEETPVVAEVEAAPEEATEE